MVYIIIIIVSKIKKIKGKVRSVLARYINKIKMYIYVTYYLDTLSSPMPQPGPSANYAAGKKDAYSILWDLKVDKMEKLSKR